MAANKIQFWVTVAGKRMQLRRKSLPNATNHLFIFKSMLNPHPPFSVALALELFVISFPPIQLIEKPHLSIPLIVCHAVLTLVLLLSVTLLS